MEEVEVEFAKALDRRSARVPAISKCTCPKCEHTHLRVTKKSGAEQPLARYGFVLNESAGRERERGRYLVGVARASGEKREKKENNSRPNDVRDVGRRL